MQKKYLVVPFVILVLFALIFAFTRSEEEDFSQTQPSYPADSSQEEFVSEYFKDSQKKQINQNKEATPLPSVFAQDAADCILEGRELRSGTVNTDTVCVKPPEE